MLTALLSIVVVLGIIALLYAYINKPKDDDEIITRNELMDLSIQELEDILYYLEMSYDYEMVKSVLLEKKQTAWNDQIKDNNK